VVEGDGRTVSCTVKAGVAWDDFVDAMVGEGLAGIECLSGIPGLAGAVPIQNVGAYGQDASQTVLRVRAYDRKLREIVELRREACAFAYRTSVFRGNHRYVLLDVTFALERSAESRPIRYAELARALGVAEGGTAPLATVRQAVIALRRNKGMVLDPSDPDTRSAGSFFTNPILDDGALEALRRRARGAETVAVFPESNNRYKVSAAWLIERAGFPKGFAGEGGRVAVSRKHALALTTRSGASTQDLVRLARTIRDGVWGRFGVMLENEPVFVGVQL
jgi:UDP-N-acetylmuramate dehydrogenase